MKVLQERENHLLGRKEVKFEIDHLAAATPTKAIILKELAAKYGVPEEHVVIDYVFTKKGIASSEVVAKIYKEKPKVKAAKAKEAKGTKGVKKNEAQASKPA